MDKRTLEEIDQSNSLALKHLDGTVDADMPRTKIKRITKEQRASNRAPVKTLTSEGKKMFGFLKQIFGHDLLVGYYIKIGFKNSINDSYRQQFVKIQTEFRLTFDAIIGLYDRYKGYDVFVAPVTYIDEKAGKDNIRFVTAVTADFDIYGDLRLKELPQSEVELHHRSMISELKSCELPPNKIICSGNGLHAYWVLAEPLEVTPEIIPLIEGVQLKLAVVPVNFKGDLNLKSLGHSLRLPGTQNYKNPDDVKDCEVVWEDDSIRYEFETLVRALNVPERVEQSEQRQYSGSLLEAYQKLDTDYDQLRNAGLECEFLKSMARNPDKQTNILWYHICNNLVHFGEHGRKLFHTISQKYPDYSYEETNRLFQTTQEKVKSQGFLPTSCGRIAEDGFECPQNCPQKTPAGMLFSSIKAACVAEKETPVSVDEAIARLKPSSETVDNVKTLEDFITNVINPQPVSMFVKEYYLDKLRNKLGLKKVGTASQYKKLLINTTFGKTGNLQVDIAESLLDKVQLKYICGDIYKYEDGVWKKYSEYLDGLIINKLGAQYDVKHVNGIIAYIRGVTYLPSDKINQHTKDNLLCLKNGMLKIHPDGRREILPHDPNYNALSLLEIAFDEQANYPKFSNFLNQCFGAMSAKDREITIQALQEWFGYSLLPGNQFHRFALLLGETRAGKGVLLRIYTALLGEENISGIPFPTLNQPINTIQLINKIANVAPEMNENDRFDEAFMKSSTGEDMISGRGHYEHTVSFVNQAKFMGSSNHLPKVFEKGDAFDMRLLDFPFLSQVPEDQRNIHLFEELKAELPGILNWAIEGRIRLLNRGRFVESQPMLDMKRKIKENSNLIVQWFKETKDSLDQGRKFETLKDMYTSFKDFCEDEGVKNIPIKSNFRQNLELIPGVHVEKPGKPDQYCVFFDWALIEGSSADPKTTPEPESGTAFDLSCEIKLYDHMEEDTQLEVPPTEQSNIVSLVNDTLAGKNSDRRAFN